MSLPPRARSRAASGLTAAAAVGRFELQRCCVCNAVQWPPREACHRCWSSSLHWSPVSGEGELISDTRLRHSHLEFFRERLPLRLGLVELDCGPVAVVFLHSSVGRAPTRVEVTARLDRAGQGVLVAYASGNSLIRYTYPEDRHLVEMTNDPRGLNVLITDGTSRLGAILATRLAAAGASQVWAGCSVGSEAAFAVTSATGSASGAAQVIEALPLDLTRDESVERVATDIGPRIDIVINTTDVMGSAREQMEAHYFGLQRLARVLGPPMHTRRAAAWVNILSVYGLMGSPDLEAFCASMAAAYSLSLSLRAEWSSAGMRVVNVFPGPTDGERFCGFTLKKLTAAELAGAVVTALQTGVTDVYPGDFAQQWYSRRRIESFYIS